jgi:sulfane dehydrogenase subunit SoxC
VDVSADGGQSWGEAELSEPVHSKALTRFRMAWRWDGGPVVLKSRATDETGEVQPTRDQRLAEVGPLATQHFNAIQAWSVAPNNAVTNIYA